LRLSKSNRAKGRRIKPKDDQQFAEKPRNRHCEEAEGRRGNPETVGFWPFLWIATATAWPRDDDLEGFSAAC